MIHPAINRRLVVLVLAAMFCGCDADESGQWVDQEFDQDTARFENNPDVMVQRGVLADRKHGYVDLLATASGIEPGMPLAVIITGPDGGTGSHLARTVAATDGITAALEFIGLTAGHPIDVDRLYYWPKGERVTVTFYTVGGDGDRRGAPLPAEHLVHDTEWKSALPELGFRFVGPAVEAGAVNVVTTYNAADTVLEVPYTVDRQTVGERLIVNHDHRFVSAQRLRIRLRPEFRNDRRVRDYVLDVRATSGDTGGQLSNLAVAMHETEDEVLVEGGFEEMFVYLKAQIADGIEPFLRLRFDDELAAHSVRDVARFTSQFLVEQQVRIEPHAAEPYISAFLPNEAWRHPNRRNRSSQPLEIHLQGGSGVFGGEILQRGQSGDVEPFEFGSAADLQDGISRGEPWQTDALFLFVTPDTPYSHIRKVHELTRDDFPHIYVFL